MADGRFPWRAMMALGFGRLALSSQAFWAMTPRELAAAADTVFGPSFEPPARSDLHHLMQRFPDRTADGHAQRRHHD
ncbi:phage tail assembly chaperone [Bauldia sp.]|uniref:phage tail assembly chaperone n=1 Tax=Bauldia sp. TaxID=2575872 RepID=UPI003BAB941D